MSSRSRVRLNTLTQYGSVAADSRKCRAGWMYHCCDFVEKNAGTSDTRGPEDFNGHSKEQPGLEEVFDIMVPSASKVVLAQQLLLTPPPALRIGQELSTVIILALFGMILDCDKWTCVGRAQEMVHDDASRKESTT